MEKGKGTGKRPAARGADGRTRRPPTETIWGWAYDLKVKQVPTGP